MTPLQFFDGKITGFGVVLGARGGVLRKFEVEMHGAWAEEHRALHLEETYRLFSGQEFKRNWAIHGDEDGVIIGQDRVEGGHMRGRSVSPSTFRIVFERQQRRTDRRFDPPQVVDFVEVEPGRCMMYGRVRLLGLTIATNHAALEREAHR